MIYLMQILNMIDPKMIHVFFNIFSDLEFQKNPNNLPREEFINSLLIECFGLEIEDERQLSEVSRIMADPRKFKAACQTAKIQRGVI